MWIADLIMNHLVLDLTTVISVLLMIVLYWWLAPPPNMPPGPTALPVMGNMLTVLLAGKRRQFLALITKWQQRYGEVFTIWMGRYPLVIISGYKVMHETFMQRADIFSCRMSNLYIFRKLRAVTGTGVINSDGPQWKELRRVTLKSLQDSNVEIQFLQQRVQEEAREVKAVLDKRQGRPTLLKPLLSQYSCNVLCNAIFRKRFAYSDPVFHELISLVIGIATRPSSFFNPANFKPFFRLFPNIRKMSREAIEGAKAFDLLLARLLEEYDMSFDPQHVKDFVNLYRLKRCKAANTELYSDANMRRVIMDLFAAGTETSATALDWLVLYMVAHPHVQARCQQVIDQVIGPDDMVTTEDRKKLPFIEAVITEVLRCASVVPFSLPHVACRDSSVGGFNVPQGCIISANLRAIHYDPKSWPQPNTFDPGRFLDEDGKFRPPAANYAPFSLGPRVCPGESLALMMMFILFCTLLHNFSFSMSEGQTVDFEGQAGVTFSAKPQPVVAARRR